MGGMVRRAGTSKPPRGAIAKEYALLNDGQQAAIGAAANVTTNCSTAEDASLGGIMKTRDEVGHGCFSCATSAHQGDDRAAGHRDIKIQNHRPAFAVFELDILELDFLDNRWCITRVGPIRLIALHP